MYRLFELSNFLCNFKYVSVFWKIATKAMYFLVGIQYVLVFLKQPNAEGI
jgi:hypothetical protein